MDDKPDYPVEIEEDRIVEPEIVGHPKPAPLWKRVLGRAAAGMFLGAAGILLILIGGVLTLSIIGAPVGIPLMILGLLLVFVALTLAFGRARFQVVSARPDDGPFDR